MSSRKVTFILCPILITLEFSQQNFEKSSNIKFHEKSVQWEPSCHRRTDMKKLKVDFRNFANTKKEVIHFLLSDR